MTRSTACAALLCLLSACAQQPPPAPAMAGMPGQDHMAMMAQCADMRRQMAQGTHSDMPGMADMMRHCDEMDRSMGGMATAPGSTAAPAATRAR